MIQYLSIIDSSLVTNASFRQQKRVRFWVDSHNANTIVQGGVDKFARIRGAGKLLSAYMQIFGYSIAILLAPPTIYTVVVYFRLKQIISLSYEFWQRDSIQICESYR